MRRGSIRCAWFLALLVAACSSDDAPGGHAGAAGQAGGSGGTNAAGQAGSGGTNAAGQAGSGGTNAAGQAGSAGSAGTSATGGAAGANASGGSAGAGAGGAGNTGGSATSFDSGVDSSANDAGREAALPPRSDGGQDWPIGDPGAAGDGKIVVSTYTTQTELLDHGAPKGREFNLKFDQSKSVIFDGKDTTLDPKKMRVTSRRVDVYVPAQYKDGTPAPILVIQDGPGSLAQVERALDNLTTSQDAMRKLPAFIAIAVQNGGDDSKGSERGLEYDTMSDRYARFIELEILPFVLADANIKKAYPGLSFTDNPEGRGALGCSSGGAAALTMGWFRPDLFRRLITYSGTFVAQQNDTAPEQAQFPHGAWDYHSDLKLIANTAQKPLRVFTNANENDNGATAAESGRHNWLMANDRTSAALLAKGYHNRYVYGQGKGHCDGSVSSATLADALVWTWRGYPAP
jgi:enterochelin esterase family protein